MKQKAMQFLYGDRELHIKVTDLLYAPVDVIVNPANSGLAHGGGIAAQILDAAGEVLDRESEQLIREYGEIETGMAVYTSAGRLPFKAVIHAVGPVMGTGDEQHKIEQAVLRSLLLCETNGWQAIAFPAISTGIFNVPIETCAQAFFRAITHFWDARSDCEVNKIMVCLTEKHFQPFFEAFREDAFEEQEPEKPAIQKEDKPEPVGHISLSEEDIAELENDDISDWFK